MAHILADEWAMMEAILEDYHIASRALNDDNDRLNHKRDLDKWVMHLKLMRFRIDKLLEEWDNE